MSDNYRVPSATEIVLRQELINAKISIFWDGDNVYYPCTITGYDEITDKFSVVYEENDSGEVYLEDLRTSTWKIWSGTESEFIAQRNTKVNTLCK